MIRVSAFSLGLGLALCGCGANNPQHPVISPALDSGVTSSNGGGTRTLGNTNSTAIGPNGGTPSNNNSAGRAY